jgi:hypothetical protein
MFLRTFRRRRPPTAASPLLRLICAHRTIEFRASRASPPRRLLLPASISHGALESQLGLLPVACRPRREPLLGHLSVLPHLARSRGRPSCSSPVVLASAPLSLSLCRAETPFLAGARTAPPLCLSWSFVSPVVAPPVSFARSAPISMAVASSSKLTPMLRAPLMFFLRRPVLVQRSPSFLCPIVRFPWLVLGPSSIWSSAFYARGSVVASCSLVVELAQLASCLQPWMSAVLDGSQTPPLDAASPAPASLLPVPPWLRHVRSVVPARAITKLHVQFSFIALSCARNCSQSRSSS